MASAILASSPEQLHIRKHFLATLGQACQRTGWRVHVFVLCSLLLTSTGCEKHAATQSMSTASQESGQTKLDVCGLIEKAEIEAIQGSPIKETKSSARPEGSSRLAMFLHRSRLQQIRHPRVVSEIRSIKVEAHYLIPR
jgi:hypothetical protein